VAVFARIQKSNTIRGGIICNILALPEMGTSSFYFGRLKVAFGVAITCVHPQMIKNPRHTPVHELWQCMVYKAS